MDVYSSFVRLTVVTISGNLLKGASASQAGEWEGYTAARLIRLQEDCVTRQDALPVEMRIKG